jgi:hypothetical protein
MAYELNQALVDGVLCSVHVYGWTGEQQLTSEDLGIAKESLPDSYKLGKKPMIPPVVMAAIKHQDGQARKLLEDLSLPFGDFGSGRFIPLSNIVEFTDRFDAIKKEYFKLVDDLITNFDKYKFEIRGDHIKAAKEAHERLSKLASFTTPLDQYINEFLERIEAKYPRVEEIRAKFDMISSMKHESLPDLAELSSADIITEDKTKIKLIFEAEKKRMTLEAEKQAEVRVKYIRDLAQQCINDTIEFMSHGKKFTDKTVNKISDMIERFQKINIVNDEILEDALVAFKRKYLDGYKSEQIRNSKDLQKVMIVELTKLKEIVTNVEQTQALIEAYKNKTKK